MKTNTKILLLSALTVGALSGLGTLAAKRVKEMRENEEESE